MTIDNARAEATVTRGLGLYDSGTIELTLTIDGHAQRVGPMRHARVPSYGLTASIRVRQSTRLDVLALDLIADVLGDWD